MQLDPQTKALLLDIAKGQLRHWLGIAGAALAAHGVLGCAGCVSEAQFVEVASGIIVASIGPLWSWWEKTGSVAAQARAVQVVAQMEARKQESMKAYMAAQAAQKELQAAIAAATAPVPSAPTVVPSSTPPTAA